MGPAAPPPGGGDAPQRPPVPAPAGTGGQPEVDEFAAQLLGDTAAGRAASQVVYALARVARSVVLYDAANQAVRGFLGELQTHIEHFLKTFGSLSLDVSPWQIRYGREVVYTEHDRERSLCLRLYRDGIRRLTFDADLSWDELAQLLGIISLRFKGVRQQEDDIVTMVWSAAFDHIQIDAVEGFETDDDEVGASEGAAGLFRARSAMQSAILDAPYTFPYPIPAREGEGPVRYRALPPDVLARIAAEDDEHNLPRECIVLATELATALAWPNDRPQPAEALPLLAEMRDYLAGRKELVVLVEVAATVDRLLPAELDERRAAFREACIDARVLRLALALPAEADQAPPPVVTLACLLTAAHLRMLFELLVSGEAHADHPSFRLLLDGAAAGHAEVVRDQLVDAPPPVAIELLRVLQRTEPAQAVEAAVGQLGVASHAVQLEALRLLRGAPYNAQVGRALAGALDAGTEDVRCEALQQLVHQREQRVFQRIAERLQRLPAGAASERELKASGAALAILQPAEALALFRDWVHPGGVLGRVKPHHPPLLWAAAGGLARLPGREPDELLEWLARHGTEELRAYCTMIVGKRREAAGGKP
ncbi:MAG: hypothetical protein H6Q02_1204 [Acidobacteria bacterium]|nr:hypothetical protein [Acidobacteriota bacterium]